MFVEASWHIYFGFRLLHSLGNCIGKQQSCRFLASSFVFDIRLPTIVSLRNPVFVDQLTVVGNVIMLYMSMLLIEMSVDPCLYMYFCIQILCSFP